MSNTDKSKITGIAIFDSIDTCWDFQASNRPKQYTWMYLEGKYPPHYPMPAIWTEAHGYAPTWDTAEYSFDIK